MKAANPVAASLCEARWVYVWKTHPERLTEPRLQRANEQEHEHE
jgi:hypothetical protein